MANGNKATFVKITNQQIYEKVELLEVKMQKYHEEMRGKNDLFTWMLAALGTGMGISFVMLISHLFGIGVG